MGIFLILAFATLCIGGPIAAGILGHPIAGIASAILTILGALLYLASGTILVITKLYRKTKASESFVRTGLGGLKVVVDGGALVIPFAHEIVAISHEVLKLPVKRDNVEALITKDNLRADVHAEFFVKVEAEKEAIQNAARSFGNQMTNQKLVADIIENKLVNALRTAAAKMTLQELNSDRDAFVKMVAETVRHDIAPNGLNLESVTISKLDQTDPKQLKDDNIFDAQGKATIAKIVQEKLTERNSLEQAGAQAREEQNVNATKRILSLQKDQAEAEAQQAADVARIQAEKSREAKEAQIVSDRQVALASVEKQRQLEVAGREQEQAIEIAERQKQQAIVDADKQVEVAKRKREEAVAEAERQKAMKESELAKAEAEREAARQSVKTVEVTAQAEREKQQQVIKAQAQAEQKFVGEQREADGIAYRMKAEAQGKKDAADADASAVTTRAKAEAEAQKLRAEGEAEAVTRKAQAQSTAQKLQAEGDQAREMVPVSVNREQVEVEKKRVEVLQQELEAREKHGQAAQEFEIAKLRVEKEAEVRIAAAEASAKLFGSIEMQIFGRPEDLERVAGGYMKGLGITKMAEGFLAGVKEGGGVEGALDQITGILDGLRQRARPEGSEQAIAPAPKVV